MLGISKSTLSSWLKLLPVSQNIKIKNISKSKIMWAKNITAYNKKRAAQSNLKREELETLASYEIDHLSERELKIIGAALYWAEGYKRTKWNPLFSNSDPHMVKLMMRFFREICQVPENRFRPQVQTHPNVSVEEAEKYWSKITYLEKKQFRKPLIQLSKSSQQKRPKNRLPYGTFRIGVAETKVLCKIKGWIRGLSLMADNIVQI